MSFSLNVKKELVAVQTPARHCRIAELAAVTAMAAVIKDGRLVLASENESVNECFTTLYRKLTGKDPEGGTAVEKKGRKKTSTTVLTAEETGELIKLLKLQDGLVPNL